MSSITSAPSLEYLISKLNSAAEASSQLDVNFNLVRKELSPVEHSRVLIAVLKCLQLNEDPSPNLFRDLREGIIRYTTIISPFLQKEGRSVGLIIKRIFDLCVEGIEGVSQRAGQKALVSTQPLSMRKICAGHEPDKVNEIVHEIILDVLGGEKRLFQRLESVAFLKEEITLRRQLVQLGYHCFAIPKIGPFPQVTPVRPLSPRSTTGLGAKLLNSHFSDPATVCSPITSAMDEYTRFFSHEAFLVMPYLPETMPMAALLLQFRLVQLLNTNSDVDSDSDTFRRLVHRMVSAQQRASENEKPYFTGLILQAKFIEAHARFLKDCSVGLLQLHRWESVHEDVFCERPPAIDLIITSYSKWIREFDPLAKVTKGLCSVALTLDSKQSLTEKWDSARLKFAESVEKALAIYYEPQNVQERVVIYKDSFQRLKLIYNSKTAAERKTYHPKMIFSGAFSSPSLLIRRELPEEFQIFKRVGFAGCVDAILSEHKEGRRSSPSPSAPSTLSETSPQGVRKKRAKGAHSPKALNVKTVEKKIERRTASESPPKPLLSSDGAKDVLEELPTVADAEIAGLTSSLEAVCLDESSLESPSPSKECQKLPSPLLLAPIEGGESSQSLLKVGDGPISSYQYDQRVLRWSSAASAGCDPFTIDPQYLGCSEGARRHIIRVHDVPYVAHKVLLLYGMRFGQQEDCGGYGRISYALVAEATFEDGGDFYRGVLTLARARKKIFHISLQQKAPSTIYAELIEHGSFVIPEEVQLDEEKMGEGPNAQAFLPDDGSRVQSISDSCICIIDPRRRSTWTLFPFWG